MLAPPANRGLSCSQLLRATVMFVCTCKWPLNPTMSAGVAEKEPNAAFRTPPWFPSGRSDYMPHSEDQTPFYKNAFAGTLNCGSQGSG
eukprot:m.483833 g.483833  ORF g.483833 m.483833 type:complete len:88 (+) comp67160_c0_seq1:395-658(+)